MILVLLDVCIETSDCKTAKFCCAVTIEGEFRQPSMLLLAVLDELQNHHESIRIARIYSIRIHEDMSQYTQLEKSS